MSSADANSWIEKAKGDIDVVKRALVPSPDPNLEAAAYHCQQAAEKAAKALLVQLGVAYPRGGGKGHDLGAIVSCIPSNHPLYNDANTLTPLTPWATAFRYPSDDPASAPQVPSVADIERALQAISEFTDKVKAEIDLAATPTSTP